MSRHQVVRNGLGPLHIAEFRDGVWVALCANRFDTVTAWRAGKQSTAVWQEWRQCPRCARRDRELRHP